jgi:hypothetical protein
MVVSFRQGSVTPQSQPANPLNSRYFPADTKTMKFLVVDNVDAMAKLASAPGTDDVW